MSLLRRLASVGLGRRDDDDPIGAGPAVRERPPTERPSTRAERRPEPQPEPAPTPAPTQSEYAKRPPQPRAPQSDGLYRPRQGDLDQHGRQVPREPRTTADDELEIPAFLRRQAN
jgi:cell division protein FtsZ